jgi:hypothetical protein
VRTGLALRIGAELQVTADDMRARRGTVLTAVPPPTSAAGHGAQRVLRGGGDPDARKLATATARKLAQQGVGVRAGDVHVWVRDGSEFDHSASRPTLAVAGTARLVALDRSGRVLLDTVATDAGVEVPRGTARMAVLGGDPGIGPAGWTTSDNLAEVADGTWLAHRATVRAAASPGGTRAARSGVARAAAAVARAGRVDTDLPDGVRTIVVALDGAGEDLPLLALTGAEAEGPTVAVRQGARTLLITPVRTIASNRRGRRGRTGGNLGDARGRAAGTGGMTVGVAPNGGAAIAGVVGSPLDAAAVQAAIVAGGLAAVAPLAPPGGTVATVTWKDGP